MALASTGRRWRRRLVSVGSLSAGAVVLTAAAPVWLPVLVAADLVRGRRRLPLARLLTFGVCWSWIELAGVARAFGTFCVGRAHDEVSQYRLMKWWAGVLMRALERTIGFRAEVEGLDDLRGGDAIVLCRHASLADSLLSAWAVRCRADVWPRYVLKRELLADPCLDIVGNRIPNHFLDREAVDGSAELEAVRALGAGVGQGVVAVIFPEGTRSSARKRERALAKIAERDPDRAARMSGLVHLLPPRPAGASALLAGAPTADVVLAWHTGFDGLDTFGGMIRRLSAPLPPVRFVARRVARRDVPAGEAFVEWLDEQWLRMDTEVAEALRHGM
ncbi:MAG: lysophospholipid acyltransferase family protein [Ilumatobacteraceae bacterium]